METNKALLMGGASDHVQRMGTYRATARMSGGRVVFEQSTGAHSLWFIDAKGTWVLGLKSDEGQEKAFLQLVDRVMSPEESSKCWQEYVNSQWRDNNGMKVVRFASQASLEQAKSKGDLSGGVVQTCTMLSSAVNLQQRFKPDLEAEIVQAQKLPVLLGFDARSAWQSQGKQGLDRDKLFDVDEQSAEFRAVYALFRNTLIAEIDRVQRIENGPQHEAYSVYKRNVERNIQQSGGTFNKATMVQLLFHGTSEQACNSIINSDVAGFMPLLAGTKTGALYGEGTYFARDASYSHNYLHLGLWTEADAHR